MKKFFDSELWKWITCLLEIGFIALLIIMFIFALKEIGLAEEEDPYADCTTVWAMCRDDSSVCIREKPKRTSYDFGAAYAGCAMKTDGKIKNGFLHVVDVPAEQSTGWVSTQYIVYEEPVPMNQKALVVSNGRLAARKGIGGKIRKWLKPMTEVTILYWTSTWCLTNYGYVQTGFLEWIGE